MPKPPASNGSADIQAQGQTKIPEFGTDPEFKGTYSGTKTPTDLKLSGK